VAIASDAAPPEEALMGNAGWASLVGSLEDNPAAFLGGRWMNGVAAPRGACIGKGPKQPVRWSVAM